MNVLILNFIYRLVIYIYGKIGIENGHYPPTDTPFSWAKGGFVGPICGFQTITRERDVKPQPINLESFNVLILNFIYMYRLVMYMGRLVFKISIIRPLTVPLLGQKGEFWAQVGGCQTIT